MTALRHDAVLFVGFGGPEKRQEVMPFLEIVTQGRGIPKERLEEVAHHYEAIGGKSPINEITRRQAAGLERELMALGHDLPVFIGQRNWHPFLAETLRQMAAQGIKRAIGFPAAAHRCEASLERYIHSVEKARLEVGSSAPIIDYVDPWYDHPHFIRAIADRVIEAGQGDGETKGRRGAHSPSLGPSVSMSDASWFFTAHSIPCSMAKESPYVADLRRTAELVAEMFGQKTWGLAYSSRSGNPRDPWLEPDVSDLIRAEAAKGIKKIFFVPIGFIADHVEILFDLDVEAQEAAREAGVTLTRSASVGDQPLFCRMMAEVVTARMNAAEASQQRSSKVPPYAGCFCFPGSETPPCRRVAVKLS